MKLIIDTNRIIASLIKEGFSRSVIFNDKFEFYYPEGKIKEILKYKDEIIEKAKITEEEFKVLLMILFERIKLIPINELKKHLLEFKNLISDVDDVPFLALAKAINADGIWSDDKGFLEQNKIKIFSTKKMSEML